MELRNDASANEVIGIVRAQEVDLDSSRRQPRREIGNSPRILRTRAPRGSKRVGCIRNDNPVERIQQGAVSRCHQLKGVIGGVSYAVDSPDTGVTLIDAAAAKNRPSPIAQPNPPNRDGGI